MKRINLLLVAVAMVAGLVAGWVRLATSADREPAPRSAKEVGVASPYIEIKNEPPPKLIVDEPLPDGLPKGVVWIQYRTENCRILPVFGKEALKVSPRVGHLHVRVDDLPWLWAHTSDVNTIDIGRMPPGEHMVTIELVDGMHQVYPGQSKTVRFTIPKKASDSALAQHEHGGGKGPEVKILSAVDIDEEVSGKKAKATTLEVTFGPSALSAPHRHAGPVFGYVLEGEFEFAVGDSPVRKLKAGDTFYEPAMALHSVSRNPSGKVKTRVLAVIVHPRDAKELVIPEPAKKEN